MAEEPHPVGGSLLDHELAPEADAPQEREIDDVDLAVGSAKGVEVDDSLRAVDRIELEEAELREPFAREIGDPGPRLHETSFGIHREVERERPVEEAIVRRLGRHEAAGPLPTNVILKASCSPSPSPSRNGSTSTSSPNRSARPLISPTTSGPSPGRWL